MADRLKQVLVWKRKTDPMEQLEWGLQSWPRFGQFLAPTGEYGSGSAPGPAGLDY